MLGLTWLLPPVRWQVNRRMRVRSLSIAPLGRQVHQLEFRVRAGCRYKWRLVTQVWSSGLITNAEILARLLAMREQQRYTHRFIQKTGL